MASDGEVHGPADVTAQWLSTALGGPAVESFQYARIGTGQMSQCYRFTLVAQGNAGPSSVVLKVAAQDEKSRQAGSSMGLYQREVSFYQEIAGNISSYVPKCYHASFYPSSHSFALLLQDAADMHAGDDVKGATIEQAKTCLAALGDIHGTMLRKGVEDYVWLKRKSQLEGALFQHLFNQFLGRYREQLTTEDIDLCARLVSSFDVYQQKQLEMSFFGMIHGDFRLDNILFKSGSNQPVVVDWQTIAWGPLLGDVAYFLGCAMPVDLRRAHFESLLETYHTALGPDTSLTLDRCREQLRQQSFFGIVMAIASSILVEQTERGDVMFMTMLKRHCALVRDLDAAKVLPEPMKLQALQPLPEDEALHTRSDEPLFNESYYFDFADPEQGIAGYVRLGITPNVAAGGWYLAAITRNGKPLVTVVDYKTPIVGETLALQTSSYIATHHATEPFKNFSITLKGKGAVYEDPASILRSDDAQGTSDIALDLKFHTDGTPYRYRIATRYEIPCLVSGEVSIDGEHYKISQQPGQRDHSWGVRNWWNMDWCWSSFHLSDGTHIHLVDLYIQGKGQLGIGYLQKAGEEVFELGDINTKWDIDNQNNLIKETTLDFTPQGQKPCQARATSLGHGPLRLVSEEGQVAFFDRAWCKCDMRDGRTGYGWLEWNRVQK